MRFLLLMVLVFVMAAPAMAQYDSRGRKIEQEVAPEPMSLADLLPVLNKNSTLNSGEYVTSKALLKRGVADSQGKPVGEVRDVFVISGGGVPLVTTVFNRLRLSGTVALDVQEDAVTGDKAGYRTGLSSEQIIGGFPQFVERTKTISGSSAAQGGFIVSKLIGADVKSAGGEEVGKLKEVLFDYKGERADLAFVTINYGPIRGKGVIVPFGVFDLQDKRGRPQLVASTEDLETIFKFMTTKK